MATLQAYFILLYFPGIILFYFIFLVSFYYNESEVKRYCEDPDWSFRLIVPNKIRSRNFPGLQKKKKNKTKRKKKEK